MDNEMSKIPETTIGIDLGDKYTHFCVLDNAGLIIEEGRIVTTKEAFRCKFTGIEPARIAIETGTHSRWVQQMLAEARHKVIVANPRKLRMIYQNNSKNDRLDAEQLARVARMDPRLLSPIKHRGKKVHSDLSLMRSRDILVAMRTRLVNHVRGVLKSNGIRPKKCSTRSFEKHILELIPDDLKPALLPVFEILSSLNVKISWYDKQVERLSKDRHPETDLLRQVSGVGPLTALCYILTLEDPQRFKKSRSVGPYLGLRPKQRHSGDHDPELRITKAGDHDLRRLLVQSAQYILGPFGKDSDLRRKGLSMAERGGKVAKKRAVVAVARKLAVLLHRLWITGEAYDPLRNSEAKTKTA
ncbi:MAG: IS110 family transposase [Planctomycetota bacterium]